MKNNRHEKILEIIKEKPISTQDDLQNALFKYGFNVTQSTVSRDIKQLKLFKGHDKNGNYCYIAPEQNIGDGNSNGFRQVMLKSVVSVNYALNDVVIKTFSGMAQSVCVAIETQFKDVMLGCIAGDDTVLLITYNEQGAKELSENIKQQL